MSRANFNFFRHLKDGRKFLRSQIWTKYRNLRKNTEKFQKLDKFQERKIIKFSSIEIWSKVVKYGKDPESWSIFGKESHNKIFEKSISCKKKYGQNQVWRFEKNSDENENVKFGAIAHEVKTGMISKVFKCLNFCVNWKYGTFMRQFYFRQSYFESTVQQGGMS